MAKPIEHEPRKPPSREEVELFALLKARVNELNKPIKDLDQLLRNALRPGGPALPGFAYKVALSEVPQVSSTLDYRGWLIDVVGREKVEAAEAKAREEKLPGTPRLMVQVNTEPDQVVNGDRTACYKKFEILLNGKAAQDPIRDAVSKKKHRA